MPKLLENRTHYYVNVCRNNERTTRFYENMQRILGLTIQEVVKKADDFDVYVFRNKS